MKNKPDDLAKLRKEAEKRLRQQTKSQRDVKTLVQELGTYQIELEMQNEELRRVHNELEASRSRYVDLYDFAPVGYFTFDKNGVIAEVNFAGAQLLGVERQRLINRQFSTFVIKEDRDIFRTHLRQTLERETRLSQELGLTRKDGSCLVVQLQSVAVRNTKDGRALCHTATSDITYRKRMEEELRHQAHHDPLTNLPNRRLMTEILTIKLAKARRDRNKLAVLLLDLDRFKEINDTLGHDAGDALLKEVVDRLRQSVRASDTLSRTGGDEFNLLLTEIPRADDIINIANKIVGSFTRPFVINGQELAIKTSIGISIYPEDGENIEALFKNADAAMYNAKEQGGNSFQFYDPSMNKRSLERLRLENQLVLALQHGEFEVYYQPQLRIDTRRIFCAEALLRWRHPERGMLDPAHFITVAEEMGYLNRMDEWVLRTACATVREWHNAGFANLCLAVNVSAKQCRKTDFIENITAILRETGFAPQYLHVEITESVAMQNLDLLLPKLNELTELGVGISIDNFGTGFSSLRRLHQLPIGKLKIDKSFIGDITSDSEDGEIVGAVIAMAGKLRIKVIASGVETEEQQEYLRSLGCPEMQGYLFSKPLPAEAFRKLLTGS